VSHALRASALQVAYSCLTAVIHLSGAAARAGRELLAPQLPPWQEVVASLLRAPLQPDDVQLCGLQAAALRLLMRLLSNFSAVAGDARPAVAALWPLLAAAAQAHAQRCGGLAEPPARGAEEGEEGLEALCCGALELLLALAGSARGAPLLQPALGALPPLLLQLMRCSGEQEERWLGEAGEWVADGEEDFGGPRALCEMLLDELLAAPALAARAAPALAAALAGPLAPAAAADWRGREAALLALGACCERLAERGAPRGGPDVGAALLALLGAELGDGGGAAPPLLVARALWLLQRAPRALPPPAREPALRALLQLMLPEAHWLVRCAAARALAALAAALPAAARVQALAPLAPAALRLGAQLLSCEGEEAEEARESALEALTALARAEPGAAAAAAPLLAPPLLAAWAAHFNHPWLAPRAAALLGRLAGGGCEAAGCVLGSSLPQLRALLEAGAAGAPQPPGLLPAALALARRLALRHAGGAEAERSAHALLFLPACRLAEADAAEGEAAASAADLLRALLRRAGGRLEEWGCEGGGGAPGACAQRCLAVAERLLARAAEGAAGEEAAAAAPPLLSALLRRCPGALAAALPEAALQLALRLRAAATPRLGAACVRFFAQLAHAMGAEPLLALLAGLRPGSREAWGEDAAAGGAVAAVLRAWLLLQPELAGGAAIAASGAALARLACCAHPQLRAVAVRGEALGGGEIRTRARARREGPEAFAITPLPQRLLELTADALLEAAEAAARGAEEEDWATDEEEEEEEAEAAAAQAAEAALQQAALAAAGGAAAPVEAAGVEEEEEEEDDEDPDEADDPLAPLAQPGALSRFVGALLRQAAADPARQQALLEMARLLSARRQQALQQAVADAA